MAAEVLGTQHGECDISVLLQMLRKLKEQEEELEERSTDELDNLRNTDWVSGAELSPCGHFDQHLLPCRRQR